MDRVHHRLQRRIDDRLRILGIEVFDQIHRALDVGEQRRDRLALAVGSCRINFAVTRTAELSIIKLTNQRGEPMQKMKAGSLAEPERGRVSPTRAEASFLGGHPRSDGAAPPLRVRLNRHFKMEIPVDSTPPASKAHWQAVENEFQEPAPSLLTLPDMVCRVSVPHSSGVA